MYLLDVNGRHKNSGVSDILHDVIPKTGNDVMALIRVIPLVI